MKAYESRHETQPNTATLYQGMVISARIHNDEQTGLAESSLDLIGERTGSEVAGNGGRFGVGGELEDGLLSLRARRDDEDISARFSMATMTRAASSSFS